MKVLLSIIAILAISFSTMAQNPFKPIPKVSSVTQTTTMGKYYKVQKLSLTMPDSLLNAWRIISVAAAYAEPNNILMAGAGYGYQHLQWDYVNQKWICKWSVSPVAFAGGSVAPNTPSSVMSVGILGGFSNNLILFGPIYNFGLKQFGVAISIGISFNN